MSDNTNNKRIYTIWYIAAYVLSVSSVLAGMRQRYRVVTRDERTLEISRRAASAAFSAFVIGLMVLYMLNRFVHPFIGAMSGAAVGDCLGALAILMLYFHLGFYAYYRWRL